jgi:hypothetical protein
MKKRNSEMSGNGRKSLAPPLCHYIIQEMILGGTAITFFWSITRVMDQKCNGRFFAYKKRPYVLFSPHVAELKGKNKSVWRIDFSPVEE